MLFRSTIAGFGSLAVAKHRGIESLGFIMAIGTVTCMVIGLTFLPALLNLLNRTGWGITPSKWPGHAEPPPPKPGAGGGN